MRQFIDTQGENIQTITEGLKTPKTDNSTKSPVRQQCADGGGGKSNTKWQYIKQIYITQKNPDLL